MSRSMKVLRTPDERFEKLPDYDFAPNYVDCDGVRVHYVDEGPKDALSVIMMHGEPSWSYLYRHMIKSVSAAGFRVLAPDLVGFGRSDKPSEISDYSYSAHMRWMQSWLDQMEFDQAVLFCQDWGGLIGLRLLAAQPERFAGAIAGNTSLPIGKGTPPAAFEQWKIFSQTVPEFPAGGVIKGGTVQPMSDAVRAAYDAPYPDESYKSGARIFPALVPMSPDMDGAAENVEAWKILNRFEKPFLTCFSDKDPVTKGQDKVFQAKIPGAQGQPHVTIKDAGHFLQEDQPGELSKVILEFIARL